jgi:hypothetical protein
MVSAVLIWIYAQETPASESIRLGCEWLRRHQSEDGLWSGGDYPRRCRPGTPCAAEPLHVVVDPALTGLALLALEADAKDPAAIRARPALARRHAVKDKALFNVLLPALAARRLGFEAPAPPAVEQAPYEDCHVGWALDLGLEPGPLLNVLDVQAREGQSATCVADASRVLVLLALQRPASQVRAVLETLNPILPGERDPDFFLWYWELRALKAAEDPRLADWAGRAEKRLRAMQDRSDGCARGSWDPTDRWRTQGGRIYMTATAVLTLRLIAPAKP